MSDLVAGIQLDSNSLDCFLITEVVSVDGENF